MKMRSIILLVLVLFTGINSYAQATREDSLNRGLSSFLKNTTIGGYGEAVYHNNLTLKEAHANVTRIVLFVGHRFSNKISFFSELEIEDAKVDAEGGELALEQAYIKFNLNKDMYLQAGLFLPRIGIINEDHLPTSFHGNFRPRVETLIIPSTWREIGVGFYGSLPSLQGFNYSLALVNGLDASGFSASEGIRGGRFEGRDAGARNLAVTASVQYSIGPVKAQVSGYTGGTVIFPPEQADSLLLESGMFGTPIMLGEGNLTFSKNGFTAKALYTIISIKQADEINRAFANNCPENMNGWYVEGAYNILMAFNKDTKKDFSVFARYESINLNNKMPENGIKDLSNNRQYLTAGVSYFPVKGVVIKADYQLIKTGERNLDLIINPNPFVPYFTSQNTFNLGIGYSF